MRPRSIIHLNIVDFAARLGTMASSALKNRPVVIAPLGAPGTRLVKLLEEYLVGPGEEADFLTPLPLKLLPGISRHEAQTAARFNLKTVSHLRQLTPAQLAIPFADRAYIIHQIIQGIDTNPVRLGSVPNLTSDMIVDHEFAMLGFLPACHPMTLIRERFQDLNTIKAANLPNMVGWKVYFAGWLITGKLVRTRQGDPMKFLTFEDDTGLVETVFFPRTYIRFFHLLDNGYPYLLSGRVEDEWGAITLTVSQVCRI